MKWLKLLFSKSIRIFSRRKNKLSIALFQSKILLANKYLDYQKKYCREIKEESTMRLKLN
jgi:hypothetical protein